MTLRPSSAPEGAGEGKGGPGRPLAAGASRALVGLSLISVQIFFGFHYIGAKIILQHIPPRAWATIRILGAVAVLLPITVLARNHWPRSLADHARLALYALFGVVINQVFFVEGLSRTVASHSSLINTMIPVATLLIALLMRRERGTPGKIAGIALSMTGALYLLAHSGALPSAGILTGDLLTLVNALSFSFFLVISKPILARYSSAVVTSLLLTYGAIMISLIGAYDLVRTDLSAVPASVWGWGAFVILFATVGAYGLNAWALKRVESSLVALFIYIQPVIGSTLAVILLGERITLHLIIAAALIFAGLYVAVTARPAAPVTGEIAEP